MREGFAQRATPTTPKTRPAQESELGLTNLCLLLVRVRDCAAPTDPPPPPLRLRPSAPPPSAQRSAARRPSTMPRKVSFTRDHSGPCMGVLQGSDYLLT